MLGEARIDTLLSGLLECQSASLEHMQHRPTSRGHIVLETYKFIFFPENSGSFFFLNSAQGEVLSSQVKLLKYVLSSITRNPF